MTMKDAQPRTPKRRQSLDSKYPRRSSSLAQGPATEYMDEPSSPTNPSAGTCYEGDVFNGNFEGGVNIVGGRENANNVRVFNNNLKQVQRIVNFFHISNNEYPFGRENGEPELSMLRAHATLLVPRRSNRASEVQEEIKKEIIKFAIRWVLSTDKRSRKYPALWINGPIDGLDGVTLEDICQTIQDAHENSIVSILSVPSSAASDDGLNYIATLAYQICCSLPATRPYIINAIKKDKLVFTRSLQKQADALIISPFRQALTKVDSLRLRWTIVVDGLNIGPQLLSSLLFISSRVPITCAVLVSSQPITDINLSADFAMKLLQISLCDFEQCVKARQGVNGLIPTAGESLGYLEDELAARAAGQPLYAETVVRFLKSSGVSNSTFRRLKAAGAFDEMLSPSENLDSLYSALLQIRIAAPNTSKGVEHLRLVGALLLPYQAYGLADPGEDLSGTVFNALRVPAYIGELFEWKVDNVQRLLDDLDVFLTHGHDFGEVCFYDPSIRDYFFDKSRSRQFFIDKGRVYADLADCSIRILGVATQNWRKFCLFFMWNAECFLEQADASDNLRQSIEAFRIKTGRTPSYPDAVNDIWPTFLNGIQAPVRFFKTQDDQSYMMPPLQAFSEELYKSKLQEFRRILKARIRGVYLKSGPLKAFLIAMAVAWIEHDGIQDTYQKVLQIPPEEAKKERNQGFNLLAIKECPKVIQYVRQVLDGDGWDRDRCSMDKDQYGEVTLYILEQLFLRRRTTSIVPWPRVARHFASKTISSEQDRILNEIIAPLLSKCPLNYRPLVKFLKSSPIVQSSGPSGKKLFQTYIQRADAADLGGTSNGVAWKTLDGVPIDDE
ncbi:hypothetical protein CVT26_016108 [Gymnopilus dilepis]|uniref:Uncharacterized protein n=1 Tax=Gymnopilus dilepis TaxID=231916 RepID=A0A409XYU5_9AGAR|nr:hypothetical protein CVT26_016108 [Gymnopilus dilepis]